MDGTTPDDYPINPINNLNPDKLNDYLQNAKQQLLRQIKEENENKFIHFPGKNYHYAGFGDFYIFISIILSLQQLSFGKSLQKCRRKHFKYDVFFT